MSPPAESWHLRGRTNWKSREAPEVDAKRARAEWLEVARAIEAHGGRVAVLAPDDALTGMPFAAEAGQALAPRGEHTRPRFLLPRMKDAHRKDERTKWGPFVERLGFFKIDLEEGIWEGQGDVARFGDVTFLFHGGRTDREGARAAGAHFDGEVIFLEIWEPAFHGNMALLPLDHARSLVACADVIEDDGLAKLETRFGRDRIHFVSAAEMECYATNVLPVGDTILAPKLLPARVRRLFEKQGMKVVELDLTELCDKAGGAARCLVSRATVADDLVIPEDASLAYWEKRISA